MPNMKTMEHPGPTLEEAVMAMIYDWHPGVRVLVHGEESTRHGSEKKPSPKRDPNLNQP